LPPSAAGRVGNSETIAGRIGAHDHQTTRLLPWSSQIAGLPRSRLDNLNCVCRRGYASLNYQVWNLFAETAFVILINRILKRCVIFLNSPKQRQPVSLVDLRRVLAARRQMSDLFVHTGTNAFREQGGGSSVKWARANEVGRHDIVAVISRARLVEIQERPSMYAERLNQHICAERVCCYRKRLIRYTKHIYFVNVVF